MKKKIMMAAAAGCIAPMVHAQSAVELYGLVDVGVEYLNHANAAGDSVTRMTGANMAGSRWGVRGQEDLGGGLKAFFNLESGFRPDTGASEIGGQSGRLFGRIATVGLGGNFGAVTLGRQAIVLNDVMFNYDPMAFALYGLATLDGRFFGRVDNSIKYVSPAFGGLTGSAYYTLGSDTVNGQGEVAGNPSVGKAYGLGLRYVAGPFSAGFVYDHTNPNTIVATNAGNQDTRYALAASYEMGAAKGFLGYRRLKSDVAGTAGTTSGLLWGGVTYLVTPATKLTGAVYNNNIQNTSADPTTYVLNLDYSLSKRTDVYVGASYAKNRTDGASGSSVGVTGGADAVAPGAGISQSGLVAGIRHKF